MKPLKMARPGVAALLILVVTASPLFAFCILGLGTSCLPDQATALNYVNARLAKAEQPSFPIVSQLSIGQAVVYNCNGNREGFDARTPDRQAADDRAWAAAQAMTEQIKKGDSCQAIMSPRDLSLDSVFYRGRDGNLCKIVVTIPYSGVIPVDVGPCGLMQMLHSKGLLEITVNRHVGPLYRSSFTINGSETQAMKAVKLANGIPVAKFGAASATKNYTQVVMGTTIGTVEFTAPITENDFANECRKLRLPCGNPGKVAIGSVKFLSRSDGWALDSDSFTLSRR